MKNQPLRLRLYFAATGIRSALRTESSFRQQAVALMGVLAMLIWYRPEPIWWAILMSNCGAVLGAELLNTSLEAALDRLHPEIHPSIRIAKDCAAGAVLLLSLTAVGVFIAFVAAHMY